MAIKTENENGAIVVSETVIAKIAGVACSTCYGVVGMAYKSTSDSIAALLKWDSVTKGIKVTTADEKVNIDLHIIVEFGVNIKVICDSIAENVRYAVESSTGFKVGSVNVCVDGVRIDE